MAKNHEQNFECPRNRHKHPTRQKPARPTVPDSYNLIPMFRQSNHRQENELSEYNTTQVGFTK